MLNRPWSSPSPAPAVAHGDLIRVRQDSSTTCLPQALVSSVPSCAVSCLRAFATTNYVGSTCANTSDLNFLCTQENVSQLTIGEAAVQCVVSFCTGQDQTNVGAYNICLGVQGAQPNLAQTITATLIATTATSTTMDNLPQTIANPSSTPEVSMIVMDSGTPSIPTTLATATGSATAPQGTSGAVSASGQRDSRTGLSTSQVVGIAVGGAAIAVTVFGLLLFFFCVRKRRQERRRSQRKSRIVEIAPPPAFQPPPKDDTAAFEEKTSSSPVPVSNGRFYAPQEPVQEKRRSFWRRSIKPEEIGVAVSPRAPGDVSPRSTSSQQSISRLLPTLPNRALWPAPLDVDASRERRRYPEGLMSDGTMSDIESAVQSMDQQAVYVDSQPFVLEKPPPAKRQRTAAPPPIRLPPVPEHVSEAVNSGRIPLTPTYDNGNIDLVSPPRSSGSPFSGTTVMDTLATVSQFPLPVTEYRLPASSAYANRNFIQKRSPSPTSGRSILSPPIEPLEQPRVAPIPPRPRINAQPNNRPESLSSDYTDIEEDTTPEELNRQLGVSLNPPLVRGGPSSLRADDQGQGSPIKDLTYPQIPRSAAVSRQAENLPQPKAALSLNPPSPAFVTRSRRDQLVRAEASFVRTDTTSSDGYLSDETIEWPVPPASETSSRKASTPALGQSPLKQRMERLRSNPVSGNRGPPTFSIYSPSLNEVVARESQLKVTKVATYEPQRSPSTKAKLTPSKAENGDLYLTVQDIHE